ncbi:MAG: grasp-with-spasm system ATP-grasp peptide maturase [Bacteroidia bacterium]|nr:grasp-with-spasm system ATP-grasp peptide maturase [Bacteroidia bacterium]
MVIISSQNSDISTGEVMDWLRSMGTPVYRINGEVFEAALGEFEMNIRPEMPASLTLEVEGKPVALEDITAFWFRRSAIDNTAASRLESYSASPDLKKQMLGHLGMESSALQTAFFSWLSDKKTLGNYREKGMNKLAVLQMARATGLEVPATLVTNSKEKLRTFARQYPEMITKCLSEVRSFQLEGKMMGMYTSTLDIAEVEDLPDFFAPSLFQQNIQKEFELRVFYLAGEVFSMAIFSQLDPVTAVDFRQYNHEKNNRVVPYALPDDITDKIRKLMSALSLNTGSVDIIKSTDRKYIFLEVNPVGQFGMVSKPCNYFLEKKIAQFLMSNTA